MSVVEVELGTGKVHDEDLVANAATLRLYL
jgi:hypothetical protein